jgi:hypothetical protein
VKNGFKVLDSDLHTMEPDGLWEKYLEAPFKKFAPQFTRRSDNASNQPVPSRCGFEPLWAAIEELEVPSAWPAAIRWS